MRLAPIFVLLALVFAFVGTATPIERCADPAATRATIVAQAGCCMFAGGVCHCEQGRVRCCDGQISSNCRC